ncbi:hypothetical protein RJ55_07004 [Drechmeria coniospora]|nr:hypothetical protein RJ55_07004 [Drechmeria coniospora]
MQLSPLQSRLAASLAASLFILALYLLLFSPHVAFAAELPALDPYHSLITADELGDILPGAHYDAELDLFDRSITGQVPDGVFVLELNKPRALNLSPGTTACYLVQKNTLSSMGASGSTNKSEEAHGDGVHLYLSANTCLQPSSSDTTSKPTLAPQLMLFISNSSLAGCPKDSSKAPKEGEGKIFVEGAVMYGVNATGEVYIGITAPNVSADFRGVYNFEVAASLDGYFHRFEKQTTSELLWMDSDSTSALLVTRNLTENIDDVQRILSQEPPYELFVTNKNSNATDGLKHSVCGLKHTAQIVADYRSNSKLSGSVRTALTLRGPGGFPKQQFYFVALNASSTYDGILVKKANATAKEKRQNGGVSGVGSVIFKATEFHTVSGTNCKVVTDLEFCDEIQYAVAGNDAKFNSTELAKAYDDYAKKMYANFEKVLMQIPCEAGRTSRYSLARKCGDCMAAYKKWLCTVSIPRCEDFRSNNPYGLVRNAAQAFPNGTLLPDEVRQPLELLPYSRVSRNSFIDNEIQPGPYKEVLPCDDICYEVVQNCPAKIGFGCPEPGMVAFEYSYGRRTRNGSTVACNYPGEARTPTSLAGMKPPSRMFLTGGLSLAAMLLLA